MMKGQLMMTSLREIGWGILLILTIGAAVGVMAQAEQAENERRYDVLPVDSAMLQEDDDGAPQLVVRAITDGCEAETQVETRVIGPALFVSLYRDLSDFEVCPEIAIPVRETLPLDSLMAVDGETPLQYVIINEMAFQIARPPAEPDNEQAPFLIPQDTVSSPLSSLTVAAGGDSLQFTFTGTHSDGCEAAPLLVLTPTAPQTYTAEVVRVLPPGVMCPAVMTDFDVTQASDIPAATPLTILYGDDQTVTYAPD